MGLKSMVGHRAGCRADILVCRFGRLCSRPDKELESSVNRQAGKPALHR
jgi:hypothetical protein